MSQSAAPVMRLAETGGPKFPHRGMITLCIICATLLQSLDQTIANVALPYMQGSFSASYDEITWVLTSYITAAAIMTAPVGWLASRFGRKPLFVTCVIGFTVASMLCGAAQTLEQIVVFRLLQGMFSAALVPLSQAIMLDIYPPEQRGLAMALWGMGVMIGPIMGPTLGGYLTAWYDWRYVFYINLPFGILAALGLAGVPARRARQPQPAVRLDGLLRAVARHRRVADDARSRPGAGLVHLARDHRRGGAGRRSACYLFLVHLGWARRPLIRPALFRDVNFSAGLVLMFAVGTLLVSSLALMAPWLQTLGNYPVATAGLLMAPRGFGNLCTIVLSGRLAHRIDARLMVGTGMLIECWSFWIMTGWTPDVSQQS